VGPTGEFVYAVNRLRNDAVFLYRIEASGTLTSRSTRPAGTLPESVAVDLSGQFGYVVNSGGDDVSQYSISAGGTFSLLTPNSVGAGNGPFSIALDPSGQFAYVANSGSDSVSQYSIGTDGRLSPLL
jgi:DNA-binding beta-propeller fold protein YncE